MTQPAAPYRLVVVPGDGIGPEVISGGRRVLEAHFAQAPAGSGRIGPSIVTIEDTTTLVAAERAAAWEEAARRMAHEIKNPLTPIRLAAEHLRNTLDTELVASFAIDELLDYRSRRPLMTFKTDHFTHYDDPQLNLYALHDSLGTLFLLLAGLEPDLKWERFVTAVRLLAERLQFLLRPPTTRARQTQPRQCERRGHDFQELAAVLAIRHFARPLRKFTMQPVLELRRVGQFVQAAPVTSSVWRRRIC